VDTISLDNINILSEWRVEYEAPIMEEALAWLEEEEQQQQAHRGRGGAASVGGKGAL
jgi:hypothetical protein